MEAPQHRRRSGGAAARRLSPAARASPTSCSTRRAGSARSGASSSTTSPPSAPTRSPPLRPRRPVPARRRRLLPPVRQQRPDRARLAARPHPGADRGGGWQPHRRAAWSSAPTCSKPSPPTSTAPTGWSPRATCRPRLIAASREWLRPLVGIAPRGGHFLHFIAFEIGRGPDGTWWVLGDRTQAPSGAGFALENRVATARVFSDLYAEAHVHRLAGFFRTFRDALQGLSHDPDARVGDPDAGPAQRHLFRARLYRPLPRLLAARGRGPDRRERPGDGAHRRRPQRPVSVLWRRLDATFADPLELDATSRLGTPGLVGAVRARLGDAGQRARLGRARDPGAARLPAADRPGAARRAADPAQHRHLVVRPARRTRPCPRQQRTA